MKTGEQVEVLMVIDKLRHTARMTFTVEIPDLATLSRVLALIDRVPSIAEVRRARTLERRPLVVASL